MKRVFTILSMFLISMGVSSAQTTFVLGANSVWTIAPNTNKDVEGHTNIHNVMNDTITVRWERIVIDITPGCASQVCDINQCYLEHVNTKTFKLPGGAYGNLIMHFLNPDTILGASAVIHLKMTNVNVPGDTATISYLFTSSLSGTADQLPAARVRLFPNPVSDYFQLENAGDVQRIRMFALDNREVARFDAEPGERYPLSGLPAGTYILALESKTGQTFQALELVKK